MPGQSIKYTLIEQATMVKILLQTSEYALIKQSNFYNKPFIILFLSTSLIHKHNTFKTITGQSLLDNVIKSCFKMVSECDK